MQYPKFTSNKNTYTLREKDGKWQVVAVKPNGVTVPLLTTASKTDAEAHLNTLHKSHSHKKGG